LIFVYIFLDVSVHISIFCFPAVVMNPLVTAQIQY